MARTSAADLSQLAWIACTPTKQFMAVTCTNTRCQTWNRLESIFYSAAARLGSTEFKKEFKKQGYRVVKIHMTEVP